jgi:hypothetical protein
MGPADVEFGVSALRRAPEYTAGDLMTRPFETGVTRFARFTRYPVNPEKSCKSCL